MSDLPVAVVGAGPAGLATSYELTRLGIDHIVFEAGDVGQTWATLYDSLVLHTGKHLSALPGSPFPRSAPMFLSRAAFLDYLRRYAIAHALPIRTHARVTRARRDDDDGWMLEVADGSAVSALSAEPAVPTVRVVRARALVWCTGIVSNPHVPEWPGRDRFRGRVLHSVDYRRPDDFLGRRVLIVGVGNSSGEIAAELASAGVAVTLAVRSGAFVVPRDIAGVPIQYLARVTSALLPPAGQFALQRAMSAVSQRVRGASGLPAPAAPRACQNIPLIGFHLTNAIRAGRVRVRPGVASWLPQGVRFDDGLEEEVEVVMLATGYRPALGAIEDLSQRDACGFARRRDRVVSLDLPGLYFVGQTYDVRGGLFNIGVDARRAVGEIAAASRRRGEGARHAEPPPATPSAREPRGAA